MVGAARQGRAKARRQLPAVPQVSPGVAERQGMHAVHKAV